MSSRPLRFCLVTTFYPPASFGGDGISVRRLAVSLADGGHHVEVVHSIDAFNILKPAGTPDTLGYTDHPSIKHHGLETATPFLSALITQQTGRPGLKARELRKIFDEGQFDVIHFHNSSLIGITALGYSPNAIRLYTIHEHWLVCPMHVLWRYNREPCPGRQCIRCTLHGRRPLQLWRYTNLLENSLEHVDAFIVPSEFAREKHLEFGLKASSPIVHIPNFLPTPAPARGDESSPHHSPYFLFAGRLERIKGAHVLVDAFRKYNGADLLIAGTGSESSELRTQAADAPHIHFLGHVEQSALERLMRHALAVVVPSIGFEVFPTTVLEAASHGTPVVANRLGPLQEMLDGHGGITYTDEVELVAALERLRLDRAFRDDMGARGRGRYLAEWTAERHLERYFDLIQHLQSEKERFA